MRPPLAWLTILLALLVAAPAVAQTFPKFTGFVVDDANVLPPEVEADLTAKLDALQRDTKRQFVVATISDLQGYPLEDYGYRLGRAWGVGLQNASVRIGSRPEPTSSRGPRWPGGLFGAMNRIAPLSAFWRPTPQARPSR